MHVQTLHERCPGRLVAMDCRHDQGDIRAVAEPYIRRKALGHLDAGRIRTVGRHARLLSFEILAREPAPAPEPTVPFEPGRTYRYEYRRKGESLGDRLDRSTGETKALIYHLDVLLWHALATLLRPSSGEVLAGLFPLER